jgi:hypothetical protein
VGNYKFKKVCIFKFIGSFATDTNDMSVEIKYQINLGNKYYGLRKQLGSDS